MSIGCDISVDELRYSALETVPSRRLDMRDIDGSQSWTQLGR
jgi:hypothetical protein